MNARGSRNAAATRQPRFSVPGHYGLRRDKVNSSGVITLRYNSRLHHVGLGRRFAATRVMILVADRDVRVLSQDGELLRELTLDPSRDYQRQPAIAG